MIDWNEAKDVRIHDLETRVQQAQARRRAVRTDVKHATSTGVSAFETVFETPKQGISAF